VTGTPSHRLRWHLGCTGPREDGWARVGIGNGGDGAGWKIGQTESSHRPGRSKSSRRTIVFRGERVHGANQTVGGLEGIVPFLELGQREYLSRYDLQREEQILTSIPAVAASSGSLKMMDLSPTLKRRFLKDAGVGDAARGYCRVSRSLTARGGLMVRGGKEVVVVVVVVTTVVRVVGAKENCPKALLEGPCPKPSLSWSSISR